MMTEEACSFQLIGSFVEPFSGRCVSDKRQLNTRRKILRIDTWTIRTLFNKGKYDNLKHEMKETNADILGVAETRWTDDGRIKPEIHGPLFTRLHKVSPISQIGLDHFDECWVYTRPSCTSIGP